MRTPPANDRSRRSRAAVAAVTGLIALIGAGGILAIATACDDAATRATLLQGVCWLLVVGGVTGNWIAGRGRPVGWLCLFALQPVWIAYSVATGQPGFILGSLAYAGAQLNGYLRTRT